MPAGLVFAVALVLLVLAAGTRRPRVSRQVLVAGAAGGALICVPAVLAHVSARGLVVSTSTQGFLLWALVVAVVATAEEAFLRGALHDAVARTAGPGVAVVVGAAAFALLHLPLYGWSALPLDLAVGVVLGGLRVHAGSWAAPAVAHVGADLVSWFLR